MVKHAPDALHDRQPEAETARHLGTLVEAVEFAKNQPPLRSWNAEAGVVHLDTQPPACAAAADQDATAWRVLDGVGDQVLQQPPQQTAVGTDGERARHEPQLEALLARQRAELDLELTQQVIDANADKIRLHRAGVQAGNVEQRPKNLLDRLERGIDVVDQPGILALALPLDQRRDIEPCGVERL